MKINHYEVTLQCMFGKIGSDHSCKSPIVAIKLAFKDFLRNYNPEGNWKLSDFDTIIVKGHRLERIKS